MKEHEAATVLFDAGKLKTHRANPLVQQLKKEVVSVTTKAVDLAAELQDREIDSTNVCLYMKASPIRVRVAVDLTNVGNPKVTLVKNLVVDLTNERQ